MYYNGSPVEGTVRRMRTDKEAVVDEESGELIGYDFESSLYYYFKELVPGAKFADYAIREVSLTDPVVDDQPSSDQQQLDRQAQLEAERQALEERRKAEAQRAEEERLKAEERQKADEQRKASEQSPIAPSTLPVLSTKSTGTANPYNNVRLVDASTRVLTSAEVASLSKAELALARNAIYARHGYQYNNAELKEYFAKQSWFKPVDGLKMDDVQKKFTKIEVTNIKLIQAQEKR